MGDDGVHCFENLFCMISMACGKYLCGLVLGFCARCSDVWFILFVVWVLEYHIGFYFYVWRCLWVRLRWSLRSARGT
jgi:hypothetical protein